MVASTLFLTWGTGGRTMTVCAVGLIWLGNQVLPTLPVFLTWELPTTRYMKGMITTNEEESKR